MVRSIIEGVGSALPKRIMTNADISKIVDTTDEWIVERTGIRSRHIAAEDETTRTLAVQAARNALEHAKLKPADIDLIIVATSTPDKTFPATATRCRPISALHGVPLLMCRPCAPDLFMA
jgi:3-oxoacyl-[acyl-carrier-protein] synthase-3